uniref:Cyclic nucleotide-binding domain-containing protein n=1 Tax=Globisporangium ultimum (strain ATCC 200006 / CBS 805.95 / DAOM BR144) TaxID=431595 RepID=K3WE10_GLOUD
MDSALPLLAPPSGDTLKFRKRNNDLDEREEEALRVQIRQHIGASVFRTKSAKTGRHQQQHEGSYRDGCSHSTASDTASLTGGASTILDATSLRAMWSSSTASLCSVSEILKLVQCMLWFADEDMAEEIDESDPKIQAGKKFLAGVEAFAMLTENELAQLVGLAEFRAYHGGETVIEDERNADGLYIVLTGTAARFISSNATMDGDDDTTTASSSSPTDTFGYQEHFGIIVSPTEATSVERVETTAVATSDLLECIWLPELVVRMLNIQPRLEHEFALILHNHRGGGGQSIEERRKSQEDILLRLLRAGVHVTVLANTRNTTHTIVLLLSAPLWLLAREDKLMAMERIIENHAEEDNTRSTHVGDDYEYHAETMTSSDRVAAFASILTRPATDKPPGVGLRSIEHNLDPVVRDVFPLHDPSMTDFILSTWFKETHSASTKRLFLLRIKDYFGLRIAFFTAFVRLYNAALVYPLNVGVVLWVFWRWIHYRSYVKALGIYGLCIAFIWAPSFLKRWKRYENSLLVEWNLLGTKEIAQPNPEFRDYVVETINVAGEGEPPDYVEVKTYDHRRRWPKYAIFGLFCTVCLVLLFVFVGVYVQWYIIAVMTPMCTDPRCPEFLDAKSPDGSSGCIAHCNELFAQGKSYLFMKHIHSCTQYCDNATFDREYYRCNAPLVGCFHTERGIVGTARWFYVLVQGIVLGLTLDIVFLAIFEAIALAFNRWENYQTEQEREKRSIEKIFLFNWVGYFYWFFLLAFVYVPNGDDVQQFVQTHVDRNWVFSWNKNVRFSRYWIDGLISMDSAFVTPMIVTQALNLVINTFVPYLLRRALIRARDSYHVKKERLFQTALKNKGGSKTSGKLGAKGVDSAHASEVSLEASSSSYGADLNLIDNTVLSDTTDQWIHITEQQQMNRDEHRVLVPLSHKRHIWTLEAIESVMRKQALGAADYPVLGMPHLLLELQWIDTRLPTKVAVRVRGPQPHELVLSRKFCETNLCYGIPTGAFSAIS